MSYAPCVAELSSPEDRLLVLREALVEEPEPLVTLTRLLRLCRDEHAVPWERVGDAACRRRVAAVLEALAGLLPTAGTAAILDATGRRSSDTCVVTGAIPSTRRTDRPPDGATAHDPSAPPPRVR